jgi:chromosome segregation ATPase
MKDPAAQQATAIRLAEVSHELDDLEASRLLLLEHIERLREKVLKSGNRATSTRAAVDLLSEHITDVAFAEMMKLETHMRDLGIGFDSILQDFDSLHFESESLDHSISDIEEEVERVSRQMLDGKSKYPRGH